MSVVFFFNPRYIRHRFKFNEYFLLYQKSKKQWVVYEQTNYETYSKFTVMTIWSAYKLTICRVSKNRVKCICMIQTKSLILAKQTSNKLLKPVWEIYCLFRIYSLFKYCFIGFFFFLVCILRLVLLGISLRFKRNRQCYCIIF